ncbi:MAG: DMT family transporter [Rhodospirillales bacterium]|nr:DMT family transporter [Rhodospirillales bacterium]
MPRGPGWPTWPDRLTDPAVQERTARHGLGIALMVLAMCLMASMDATAKWLVEDHSIAQILLIRFCFFLVVAIALAARKGFVATLKSDRPGLQVLRCLVMLAEIYVFIWAFSLLPLADVHGIAAVSPLIALTLAVPMLGERIGWHSWVAVGVGFVGVLIIVRPGSGVMESAALVAIAAAFLWALFQVLIRKVGLRDSVETTSLYTAFIAVAILACVAPFMWAPLDREGWLLMLAVGALGSAGHLVLFRALQLAPASLLQPFSYTMVLWATMMGYLLFDDFPDTWTITGIGIVVAGGLYAFSRERKIASQSD